MSNLISIDQIVVPTSKWQVTIPKKVRERAGLEKKIPLNVAWENGRVVMIPVKRFVAEDVWTEERRKKLLLALRKIRGVWADDKNFKTRQKQREKAELKAAKKMRKLW